MRSYQGNDYTPWSFVIPVALAVMLGVLAADFVKMLVLAAMAKAAIAEVTNRSNDRRRQVTCLRDPISQFPSPSLRPVTDIVKPCLFSSGIQWLV